MVPFIEVSRIGKSVEIDGSFIVARGCRGARIGKWLLHGDRVSFGEVKCSGSRSW